MPFSQLVKLFGRISQIFINLVLGGVKSKNFWTGKEKLSLTFYKIMIVNK